MKVKMEKMKIDEFFKEKLTNLEIEFDEEVWNDLEKKLDTKKRKNRVFVWWWHWERIAAVLVLGFLGYGTYYFLQKPSRNELKQVVSDWEQNEKVNFEQKNNFVEKSQESFVKTQNPKTNITLHKDTTKKSPKSLKYFTEELAFINFDRNLEEKNLHRTWQIWAVKLNLSDSLEQITENNLTKTANLTHTIGLAFSPVLSPNGLQAGLGYTHEFGITERASLVSGLAYTPWKGTINNLATNTQNPIADPVSSNIRLQTIEIPLEAKVKITENLSVSSGVSNTLLLQEKVGEVVNNDFEWSISSLNVGVQYDIHIGKNSQLNLQPYYRFPLQSIGSAGTQISGFGLRAGYSYGKGKIRHRNTIEN